MSIAIGLSVNNTRALLEGLFGGQTPFYRTAKFDIRGRNGTAAGKKYRGLGSWTTFLELAMSAYFVGLLFFTIRHGLYGSIPFVMLFLFGYLYVGILSVTTPRLR